MNKNKVINSPIIYLFIVVLLPLIFTTTSVAQQTDEYQISLEQAIKYAMTNNVEVRKSELNYAVQHARLRGASAVFLPQIGVEYNALRTNDPLNVFGFKLKQQAVTMQDFDPMLLNNPNSYENYNAKIEVRQPVFNADMLSQRDAARTMALSSKEQIGATKSMTRFEVSKLYYQLLLQQEQIRVLESGLKTAEAYHRQARVAFAEGIISRSDVMASSVFEMDLRSRLLHTQNEYMNLSEQFLLSVGLPETTLLILTDALSAPNDVYAMVPFQGELSNAYLRAIDYQVKAADFMQAASRNAWLPRVNAFASFEFNDQKVAGFGSDGYMIGAQISWTLFSGLQRSGALREAQAQRKNAEIMFAHTKREFTVQLEQAYRNLEHAQIQIELTQAMIEQAQEDARIRENRFNEGMEQTTNLLQAETRLLEAKLNHSFALFQQKMSIAAIQMILE